MVSDLCGRVGGFLYCAGGLAVAQGGAASAYADWSCEAVGGGIVVGQVAAELSGATSSPQRHAAILLSWSFGASASTISMSGALGISISGTLRNFRVVEVHSTPCGASCSGR